MIRLIMKIYMVYEETFDVIIVGICGEVDKYH